MEAQRSRGASLFPHANDGQKYLFKFTVKIPHYNETSQIQLKWTAFSVELEVSVSYIFIGIFQQSSKIKNISAQIFKAKMSMKSLMHTVMPWTGSFYKNSAEPAGLDTLKER